MTVITMMIRQTTTITAPTAMPISLVQVEERMTVSAVPVLSKEGEKLHVK